MTLYGLTFYLLAGAILGATALAVTRHNLVHAVLYLAFSFVGTAMVFYLLGAPFLAALEIIIYAGAIMVLFLFIVMMLGTEPQAAARIPRRQLLPAIGLALVYFAVAMLLALTNPGRGAALEMAVAAPRLFGRYVFRRYWLAVEIISVLLLIALVGAVYLGRAPAEKPEPASRTGKK